MADGSEFTSVHDRFRLELERSVDDDGGLSWVAGGAPESEPTALAALALDADASRAWLAARQAEDGSVLLETGEVRNTGPSGLVALAMPPGAPQQRALDFAIGAKGGRVENSQYEDDPLGWGWVPGTFAWVEPTARVVLAARILRPGDLSTIDEGVTILERRETEGGGWNYGNADVRGTDLTPYVQTSAMAIIALAGLDVPSVGRGIDYLRRAALVERGGMSLAMSLLAFRLAADDRSFEAQLTEALVAQFDRTAFLDNLGVLAWAVLATDPDASALAVPA